MDPNRNGSFRFFTPIKRIAFFAMSVALLACAQPPAGAQNPKEESMHGSPSAEDIRTEQDRVAAIVDNAAVEAAGAASDDAEAPERAPLPQGPALIAETLEAGIVRLVTELKGPEQTQVEFVGQALGVAMASDGAKGRAGVQGSLGSGTYEIAVWTLYPNAPGKHVSIRVDPPSIHTCALDFARVEGQLHKAGYESQQLPRSMDPSISFSKDLGTVTGFVRLDVDSHDTPQCIRHVAVNLEAKDV